MFRGTSAKAALARVRPLLRAVPSRRLLGHAHLGILKDRFDSRLRNKIALPFALLVLLIAAMGTLLAVRLTSSSLEERLASYVADAIAVSGDGLRASQESSLSALRAMAYTEGVPQALSQGDEEQLIRLLVPLKMNYRLGAVEVVDSSGQEVLGIQQQPYSLRVDDFQLSQQRDLWSWPIVQQVLSGGPDFLGDKYVQVLSDPTDTLLWIGGPVREEGRTVGAILVGTPLDLLVQDLATKATAKVSLYDDQGRLLASTLYQDGREGTRLDQGLLSDLERGSRSTLLARARAGGREYLAGYSWVALRGVESIILSAAVPTEQVARAGADARTTMIALFSVAAAAVLFLGFFIAGRITAPLRALVTASERVASYDFSQRVEPMGNDELGQLGAAFNFMARELEKHTAQLSQSISDLTVLYETSTHLNKAQDVTEILEVAADALYRSGQVTLVLLLLRGEQPRQWSWAATKGLTPSQNRKFVGRSLSGLPSSFLPVTQRSRPLILDQEDQLVRLREELDLVEVRLGSAMVIPLNSEEQLMGLILLAKSGSRGFSDQAQLVLLQTLSAEIGWSINRAQLYGQVTQQVTQLATLQQVSRSISATLSRGEVLAQILRNVVAISHAELAAISLLNPKTGQLQLGSWRGTASAEEDGWPGQKMAEQVLATVQPCTVRNGELVPVKISQDEVELGDSLCVPVQAEGKLLGALFLRLAGPSQAFLPKDLVVVSTVANQAGMAIRNALLYEEIRGLYQNIVKSLATAVDARDPYTHGHSHRVAANSLLLAETMGLDAKQREAIELAGFLHDIGKIGVRDSILLKAGNLDSEERRPILEHPSAGVRILEPVGFDPELLSTVLSHHERMDGKGYPAGLKGEAIPLGSRILAIVDAFDAMVSDRPYRAGMAMETAVEELARNAGSQFDPVLVDRFMSLIARQRVILPGEAVVEKREPIEPILAPGSGIGRAAGSGRS